MKTKPFNSAASRRNPEVGKWVTVTVNGNQYHESRILISPYTMREFNNLLSHITEKLKPSFGAVWRLFTEDGHEVKKLDEIQGGARYVASGRSTPFSFWANFSKANRRELRSHSAVGALCSQQAQQGTEVEGLAASSDTNVKQPKPKRPTQCRSAPRRRKVGEQSERNDRVWDQPHYDQHQLSHQSHQSQSRGRAAAKDNLDLDLSDDGTAEVAYNTGHKANSNMRTGAY